MIVGGFFKGIVTTIIIILVLFLIFCAVTPSGRVLWNNWFHDVKKADDATNYETKKHVEDTCRAMISSYESDRLTYEQYKDSESEEQRSWADQAKMRANKTATTYNNYILENSYVWSDNIPSDIRHELEYID